MKTKVTTTNRQATMELECFLREWDVEFDFYDSKTHGFIYTFDDHNDRLAIETEAKAAIPGALYSKLIWL